MKRRSVFTALTDEMDDDDLIPTSYCPKCAKHDVKSLLGPRIYDYNEPEASDHDKWMMCPKCGLLLARVHAQQESKISGFVEVPESIHDSGRPSITPIHDRNKQFITAKLNTRPIGSDREDVQKKDKDLKLMLSKGKKLISYNDNQ